MTFTNKHIDFENYCRKLIGLTIVKVEYAEISYEPMHPKPCYSTRFSNLDTVDFSIFFHTGVDQIIEFYWDGRFFQYGIGIKVNEPSDFSGFQKWDVSNNDLWRNFIKTKIIDIKLTWETATTTEEKTGKSETFTYPQDIKITFSNDRNIFISAAAFLKQDDNEVYGMLDNLTVTDSEELAREIKMIN